MVSHNPDKRGTETPFATGAPLYRAAGWLGPLPLPQGRKHPPPTGWTGRQTAAQRVPDDALLNDWIADPRSIPARAGLDYRNANICLRLWSIDRAHEIVGIDVDDYLKGGEKKNGGTQLKSLEDHYGTLPDTWISSARCDGVSGIRYFTVPAGLAWRGKAAEDGQRVCDIEIIQKGHRFAVVWPSINPEADSAVYRWYPPGVKPDGHSYADEIPRATEIVELPDAWIDFLTRGRVTAGADLQIDMDSSPNEIHDWAYNALGLDEPLCSRMKEKVRGHIIRFTDEATSHPLIVNAHMNILHLAIEGHRGWDTAVTELNRAFVRVCVERDKRTADEVRRELFRSRINGLRKTKGRADERIAIGARAVDPPCGCGLYAPAYRPLYRPGAWSR